MTYGSPIVGGVPVTRPIVTAETITDEQIRELLKTERRAFDNEPDVDKRMEIYKRVSEAMVALDTHYTDKARSLARARCAEILNQRAGGGR